MAKVAACIVAHGFKMSCSLATGPRHEISSDQVSCAYARGVWWHVPPGKFGIFTLSENVSGTFWAEIGAFSRHLDPGIKQ